MKPDEINHIWENKPDHALKAAVSHYRFCVTTFVKSWNELEEIMNHGRKKAFKAASEHKFAPFRGPSVGYYIGDYVHQLDLCEWGIAQTRAIIRALLGIRRPDTSRYAKWGIAPGVKDAFNDYVVSWGLPENMQMSLSDDDAKAIAECNKVLEKLPQVIEYELAQISDQNGGG